LQNEKAVSRITYSQIVRLQVSKVMYASGYDVGVLRQMRWRG
jgi:hypothetical protein